MSYKRKENLAQELQSLIRQITQLYGRTPSGNYGQGNRLINKTGLSSVKGTLIEAHATTEFAFRLAVGNTYECIGVVYTTGIADGDRCLVIDRGIAEVLLKNATGCSPHDWMGASDVAGRAYSNGASPPAAPTHFREVGHCFQTNAGGTDELAEIEVHFN